MKHNQEGFGAVEGLLAIIAITLVVGLGFYVFNVNNDKDTKASTVSSKQSATPVSLADTAKQATKTTEDSDKDLIIAAVRKDGVNHGISQEESNKLIVTVDTTVGDNAIGKTSDGETGAEFIVHKDNGVWAVIYTGQQKPGKEIGAKYGLPADWYSVDY
ncbi:hypothetical protein H7097_01850 [Aeromicrobium sp.]|nr:hypothetical protein [Candidatus Saccharibacteria bacterium]